MGVNKVAFRRRSKKGGQEEGNGVEGAVERRMVRRKGRPFLLLKLVLMAALFGGGGFVMIMMMSRYPKFQSVLTQEPPAPAPGLASPPYPRWAYSVFSHTPSFSTDHPPPVNGSLVLDSVERKLAKRYSSFASSSSPTLTTETASIVRIETTPTYQRVYILWSTMTKDGKVKWSVYRAIVSTETPWGIDRARFMEPLWEPTLRAWSELTISGAHQVRNHTKFLVLLVSYGDSTFCNDPHLPIFTLSAPVDCNYAWPIPTYESYLLAQKRDVSARKRIWPLTWDRWLLHPSWDRRYQKAVWRGSPTGVEDRDRNPRWKLCQLGHEHSDVLDAKFVGSTERWPQLKEMPQWVAPYQSAGDRLHYRAVVDVDGNSWSARFGQLLCSSSVVIKVQPQHVDYFYPELQPWQHYIPVRADMSDLIEVIRLTVADQPPAVVQQIITRANRWCQSKFQVSTLAQDMADILHAYGSRWQSSSLDEERVRRWLDHDNFTRLYGL